MGFVAFCPVGRVPLRGSTGLRRLAVRRLAERAADTGGVSLELVVTKEFERARLRTIAEAPVTALQGVGDVAAAALMRYRVRTVRDLADWKFARSAEAIAELGAMPSQVRLDGAEMNVAAAVDKDWETAGLGQLVDAPLHAIQGITPEGAEELAKARIKTIGQLGSWKFYKWARAIVVLADLER